MDKRDKFLMDLIYEAILTVRSIGWDYRHDGYDKIINGENKGNYSYDKLKGLSETRKLRYIEHLQEKSESYRNVMRINSCIMDMVHNLPYIIEGSADSDCMFDTSKESISDYLEGHVRDIRKILEEEDIKSDSRSLINRFLKKVESFGEEFE